MGGSGKRSLPMVCPSAIGKAFGLAAATRATAMSRKNLLAVLSTVASVFLECVARG
jgi:hypothetical protein